MSVYVTVDDSNNVVSVVRIPNPVSEDLEEVFPGNPEYTTTLIKADGYPSIIPGWVGTQKSGKWSFVPFEESAGYILQVRAEKAAEVSGACAAEILSGFKCDALVPGTAYSYPSQTTDQQNLNTAVVSSLLPDLDPDWVTPFWCADDADVWALRDHSAVQIQAVSRAAKASRNACSAKKAELDVLIAAASTVSAVRAITWLAS